MLHPAVSSTHTLALTHSLTLTLTVFVLIVNVQMCLKSAQACLGEYDVSIILIVVAVHTHLCV